MRAPSNLGPAGRRLWRRLASGVEWSPVGLALLGEACMVADELARLHDAVAAGELIVDGSMGQPKGNALLGEIRRHGSALRELLAALPVGAAVPVEDPFDAIAAELAGMGA